MDLKPDGSFQEEFTGNFIFEILDLINDEGPDQTTEFLYLRLRGIFLRNLRHDETLGLSHEDFILFYVLTVQHPDLPLFIRDKYGSRLGPNRRVLDFKSEILLDSDRFLEKEKDTHLTKLAEELDPMGILKYEFKEGELFKSREIKEDDDEDSYMDTDVKIEDDRNIKQEVVEFTAADAETFARAPKKENTFFCQYCDYACDRRKRLKDHVDFNHIKKEYPCDICEEHTAKSKQKLRKHKQKIHNVYEGKLHCDQCEFRADKRFEIKSHRIKEHDIDDNLPYLKDKVQIKDSQFRQRHTIEGQTMKCPECDFTHTNVSTLKMHIKLDHIGFRFKCDVCNWKGRSKKSVERHVKAVHEKVRFKCDLCEYEGTSAKYVQMHKESKHMGINYYCDQCPKYFNRAINLKYHVERVHEGKGLLCDQCDFKALFQSELNYHIESVHTIQEYLCEFCDFITGDQKSLHHHKKVHHSEEKDLNLIEKNLSIEDKQTYLCELCSYVTHVKKNLQKHFRVHHSVKSDPGANISCVECPFTAKTKTELLRHAANEHGHEVFLYEEDTKTDDIPGADKPVRRAPKRFHCLKCPFETNFMPYLVKHTANKHGTKVFACEECNFETRKPKEYKAHLKYRHSAGGNRLPCEQCHFTATRADALKRHIEAEHEGVRYHCDLCDYTSKYKADIKKHEQHVHEGKIYNCADCSYTCRSSESLRKHVKSHIKVKHDTPYA